MSFFVFYDIINYLKFSLPFLLASKNSAGKECIRNVKGQRKSKEGKGVMDRCMDFIQRSVSKIAQINCAPKVLILGF